MQAVILATSEKTALASFCKNMPVAMLPIADRPAASLTVERLARNGCRDILISLYGQDESIEAYFGDGRRWGVNMRYLLHRQPLGSAGMLNRAKPYLHDTFIVLPAGGIIDLDIAEALEFHRRNRNALTMILHTPLEDHAGRLTQIDESGNVLCADRGGRTLASTGAYIIEPRALSFIPSIAAPDVENDLIEALRAVQIPVMGYEMRGYWNPLDTLKAYDAAQRDFLSSAWHGDKSVATNAPLIRNAAINALQIAPGIWIGKNQAIHPTASIATPVYVGDNCMIGREVELGPFTVIGRDVIVDDEATINDSTILPHTYVGRLVNVGHRIVNKGFIGDPATSETSEIVDSFLFSETEPRQIMNALHQSFDTAIALILLLLSLPLTLLISLVVFITSEGRLLSRQSRVKARRSTPDGKTYDTYHLFRFQTRRRNESYSIIGRALEGLEWNRIPELWNVIKGDLRLVGVKPLSPEETCRVSEEWQERRFEYPGGITGLWYVQTNRNAELDDILITDAYYVATRNWRDDIALLFKTPLAWVRRISVTDHNNLVTR